jgi:hypothetical protein
MEGEYKVYGVREYTSYVWADSEDDAVEKAESVPLIDWEPNEIKGEEICPKEACEVGD